MLRFTIDFYASWVLNAADCWAARSCLRPDWDALNNRVCGSPGDCGRRGSYNFKFLEFVHRSRKVFESFFLPSLSHFFIMFFMGVVNRFIPVDQRVLLPPSTIVSGHEPSSLGKLWSCDTGSLLGNTSYDGGMADVGNTRSTDNNSSVFAKIKSALRKTALFAGGLFYVIPTLVTSAFYLLVDHRISLFFLHWLAACLASPWAKTQKSIEEYLDASVEHAAKMAYGISD